MWWQKERFTGQRPHRTGGFAPEHQELLFSQFDRINTLRMLPKADRWFSQHPGMNLHSADFSEWEALELQWCIVGTFWVYKLYICCVLAARLDIWGQLWAESTAPCCCSLPSIPATCQMDSAQGWDLQGERWISAHGNEFFNWGKYSARFQTLWLPCSAVPCICKVSDRGNSYNVVSSELAVLCELHHRTTCGCELAAVMLTGIMEQSSAN